MPQTAGQTALRRRLAGLRMKPRPGLWLTRRLNRNGAVKFYFQPSRFDAEKGWKTVRLHHQSELPISTEAEAEVACQELAAIYLAWKQGKKGYGPGMIDELGRPVWLQVNTHDLRWSASRAQLPPLQPTSWTATNSLS